MSISAGFNFNSPSPLGGFTPTGPVGGPSVGAQPAGPDQIVQMLQQMMQSLSQLTQNWSGLVSDTGQPPSLPTMDTSQPPLYNPFDNPSQDAPDPGYGLLDFGGGASAEE